MRRRLRRTYYWAVVDSVVSLVASRMDKKLETDNLEMRLQALENQIHGERRNKSGKPLKVRSD